MQMLVLLIFCFSCRGRFAWLFCDYHLLSLLISVSIRVFTLSTVNDNCSRHSPVTWALFDLSLPTGGPIVKCGKPSVAATPCTLGIVFRFHTCRRAKNRWRLAGDWVCSHSWRCVRFVTASLRVCRSSTNELCLGREWGLLIVAFLFGSLLPACVRLSK